ncbi:hypothetical protein GCM10010300_78880 [Streptomyces olivaceoviridis]|uniref:hypothetical protein n=1 Tax=Streptomyces olivaceoviridis TaxID=1921 RepID=UPI00167230F2|nr:hypothetical protein [Streptomyces olivaceoviridis]GGZ23518.1 hypothetical protein GCM10010300_78880 [Streptomyces olivaceoviridis]
MAWDEWEQLKAKAAQNQSAHMRLNHVTPDNGGGESTRGDLTVHQKDLAAIGSAAHELFQDFGRFSDHARMSSIKAAGGLKSEGFDIGAALDHVAGRWVDQVQSLLDACAHISNHLRYTKDQHAADESYIAGTLSSISQLDQGFDERKGS